MRAILLHLSDVHLMSGFNHILGKVNKITETVNMCLDEDCICFLVISGDIANEGKSEQYLIAEKFIRDLQTGLRSNPKIKNVPLIIVPGNHDCNFEGVKSTREHLINHLQRDKDPLGKLDATYIDELNIVQSEFFNFASRLIDIPAGQRPLVWTHSYPIGEFTIRFVSYNSAWMSKKIEEPNTIFIPLDIDGIADVAEKNTISIAVFHHPYNWFESEFAKDFKSYISSHFDLVMTGHEHDPDNETVVSVKGTIQEIMQGGRLQSNKTLESSFNLQVIDCEKRIQKKYILLWDNGENYYRTSEETEWVPFVSLDHRDTFSVTEEFGKTLSRLDVQITHPILGRPLEADEIYVNQPIEIQYTKDGISKKTTETTHRIERLFSIIKERRKVMIIGNKYLGKTLVIKKLYKLLLRDEVVPIHCTGRELSNLSKRGDPAIKALFEAQYKNIKGVPYNKYCRLPFSQRAVLIDDIQKSDLDLEHIEAFLHKLDNYFGIIVISCNPVINLNEMFSGPGVLIEYTRAQLNDFGLPDIDEVVEKWVRISDPDGNEPDIQNKIKALENNLFHILGRDIIPRNPFFLLTILHNLKNNDSPEAISGAYGYYFQTIINVMIAKLVANPEHIAYVYDYFSNLAFYMLINKTGSINKSELAKFNSHYLDKTGFTLDLEKILANSVKEEVLRVEGELYAFGFSYYFEFFAAKYLADNLRNPKIEKEIHVVIEQTALHLHKDVYSNIMMFLCFHSKDPIITDIITKNALKLFEGIENFNFSKDVEFLNKILPEPKLRTISGKETKETKAQLLESDDATSLALSEFSDLQNNLRQDITKLEDLTIVTKLLYAFSAVKVLGQILRRYLTGDLDDRILFTKQCYDLGLKTIKFIISEIENHVPELQSDLATAILERNPSLSSREVSDATTDWIWLLTESICLSSIKNTSHNVGAPELGRVYNILLERYPSLAYEFIDISIELDHFKELPEGKIEKLAIKLDQTKNYFSKDLLCLIFTYHIYQVYTPMFKIQKMCSVLGLQRLLSEPNIFLSSRKTLPRK